MGILTESKRRTAVSAVAVNGNYEYAVDYEYANKELSVLRCSVTHVDRSEEHGEQRVYVGYMSRENNSLSMNFPDGADILAHANQFNQIIDEVKNMIEAE